jgi:hypothetical protein
LKNSSYSKHDVFYIFILFLGRYFAFLFWVGGPQLVLARKGQNPDPSKYSWKSWYQEDNINALFPFKIYGFLTLSSLTSDGRGITEHRQLFLRTGVISQAKGSAYVEQGSTKVSLSLVLSI